MFFTCCCEFCNPCPCETPPATLSGEFTTWSAATAGSIDPYCDDCNSLNNVATLTSVAAFTDPSIGFSHDFFYLYPPCDSTTVEDHCLYEAIEDFDCIPQICYECTAGCDGLESCDSDSDCSQENCPDFYCEADATCGNYGGGTCEPTDCTAVMTCVFDDELDPDHLAGVCAISNDCTFATVTNCTVIQRYTRVVMYVASDRKPVISVHVILLGYTSLGVLTYSSLKGCLKLDSVEDLACDAMNHVISLTYIFGATDPPCYAGATPTITITT